MNKPETISLYEFFQRFPNEEAARLYFEGKRWKEGAYCAHCGSTDVVECKGHIPMPYRCKDCRKHFSVRTGTVLAESRLPLQKWLMAIYMMTTARKGIPSTQMAKELGITQKSAWFLAQRIRETWMNTPKNDGDKLGPETEIDECYIGGCETNRHRSKRKKEGRGIAGKVPVVGARDRNGMVVAEPMRTVNAKTIRNFIGRNIEKGTTLYTDSSTVYNGLIAYKREVVNHSVGEYVRAQAHTNGIESFWALLKRGYYGVYHFMSPKHLHRYVNEFSFRHNTANVGTMDFIDMTIEKMQNRRLTYKELINVT